MLLLRSRGDKLLRVGVAHVETSLRAANVVDRAYAQHSDRRAIGSAPGVCHAVRVHGSNVTLTPSRRAGSGGSNRGSIRTVPVKYSAGPLPEGCEPLRLISIVSHFGVSSLVSG
jgi:hypothetical protein